MMRSLSPESTVAAGVATLMLLLVASFLFNWWGRPYVVYPEPDVRTAFADTVTVRESAAKLILTGGDISMLTCYSCHDRDEPVELKFDEDGLVIMEEHDLDFEFKHGRYHRNTSCFNCHAQTNLERLETRDGRHLKLQESNQLCGSCHGPTYRDWEAGVHGRLSGFWSRSIGPVVREDCTSCHDPHAPAFPTVAPAPGPHLIRPLPAGSILAEVAVPEEEEE